MLQNKWLLFYMKSLLSSSKHMTATVCMVPPPTPPPWSGFQGNHAVESEVICILQKKKLLQYAFSLDTLLEEHTDCTQTFNTQTHTHTHAHTRERHAPAVTMQICLPQRLRNGWVWVEWAYSLQRAWLFQLQPLPSLLPPPQWLRCQIILPSLHARRHTNYSEITNHSSPLAQFCLEEVAGVMGDKWTWAGRGGFGCSKPFWPESSGCFWQDIH